MAHIEIKVKKYLSSTNALKIIKKGTVVAVLTIGEISKPAKAKFDEADIAWRENVPKQLFMKSNTQEEA